MRTQLNPTAALVMAGGLLLLAVYVFGRVRSDYRARGRLYRPVFILQSGYFFVYALSSFLFIDPRFRAITSRGALLGLAVILMMAGVSAVLLSMSFLGRRSFGMEAGLLCSGGIYHYSRNPQLAGRFAIILGYALLWPSWIGALWAGLWLPICWLMIRAEEEHLASVFGKEYEEYCRRTPRFIGFVKKA